MNDIVIHPYNATYNKIETEPSIAQDLYEYLTFKVPNYEFMKSKSPEKLRHWSGEIHLYNRRTKRVYVGLTPRIEEFARDRGFTVGIATKGDVEFSAVEAAEFIKTLGLPEDKTPRYYQFKSFLQAVRKHRTLIVSPTASGKSLFLYLLIRYYLLALESGSDKILLMVPTINLVHQMISDFKEYGWEGVDRYVHLIYEGQEKHNPAKPVYISTWQSIYNEEKEYFDFNVIICDEVHHAQADSIKGIMEAADKTDVRIGCTGTLNDTLTHRLVLEGLFGEVYEATTTKELIEQKHLAELRIKCIILKHLPKPKVYEYSDEIEYLAEHEPRNRFIQNLALSLHGNTMILFRLVDKHGKGLYNRIKNSTDRPIYLIHGGVDGEERESIRRILAKEQNAILVGSYGTVSTGINIPSLRNIIFASPYKSRIKVLQSIGRGLRMAENKTKCTVFDLADDLTKGGSQNVTLKHFNERVKLYYEEDFEPQIYRVDLKNAK